MEMSSSSVAMVTFAVVIMLTSYVAGQTYNSQNQICCNGVVFDITNNQTACCGSNATYDPSVSQCCSPENTIIPILDPNNSSQSLTCCGGKGQIVPYNDLCCAGVISTQPPVVNQYTTFSCCDTTIMTNLQSCCNGNVTDDANQVLGCCNNVFYDTTSSICCNNNVVQIPASSQSYNFQCCGNGGYDNTIQICDSTTGTVFAKPNYTSCENQYSQICNGKVLGPQQVCCNGKPFNPPNIWIVDDSSTGGGYIGIEASCCPSGNGIVQDPNTETCCSNGVAPIDFPSQQCCGTTLYDPVASSCCGNNVVPVVNSNCCGNEAYQSSDKICCANRLYKGGNNIACCLANQ